MKRNYVLAVLAVAVCLASSSGALADIYNWQTGQVIPGTEGIWPGPGIDLSWWDTSSHNLQYADFGGMNLQGSDFVASWLDDANFSSANLTGAWFNTATLTGADLTDAVVVGADFSGYSTSGYGITMEQLYSTASYKAKDLAGIWLQGNDLTGCNLAGQNLTGANFNYTTLDRADLSNANLSNANLTWAHCFYTTLTGANLSNANLKGAALWRATLTGADLSNANLTEADFYYASLTGADLSNANLTGAWFHYATLTDADLTDAVVAGAHFGGNGITKEQLYSTASYKAKDLTGIGLGGGSDLTGWNFAGQNLTGAGFGYATLTGADLSNANLTEADFEYAGLSNANLSNANLTRAYFWGATLTGADLTGADLRGAVGASLAGATLHNTIRPDGQIQGLALGSGETLCVRNSTIAITVSNTMTFDADSTLYLELEPHWTSTINLAEGVTPQLGGTLYLGLAEGADPVAMYGHTFYLFNWNGPLAGDNHFSSIVSDLGPNYVWDTSDLYNGGTVTLMTPEPGTMALIVPALLGFAGIAFRRMRKG